MTPTKKQLLEFKPCSEGVGFLAKHKTLKSAWENCTDLNWMIWALNKFGIFDEKIARRFACDCTRHTLHFFEDKYPEDKRPRLAIEASERTIEDQSQELLAARAAAWTAASDAARTTAWAATSTAT